MVDGILNPKFDAVMQNYEEVIFHYYYKSYQSSLVSWLDDDYDGIL